MGVKVSGSAFGGGSMRALGASGNARPFPRTDSGGGGGESQGNRRFSWREIA